jgi:uncharacterized SAM-binding protein YcdF (DUF218 family)
MFELKKLVSFWLMPLPLTLLLMVAGLAFTRLGRAGRPERLGRLGSRLLILAALVLVGFANGWVSDRLLRPLEATYPPIPELTPRDPLPAALAGCRYVVVLGSGHSDLAGWPATSQLATSGLGRLIEGVRLLRCLPGSRLIVSGPGAPGASTHASVLARAAASLGVDPASILRIETARDTEEEAAAVHRLVGGSRVALVTSAFHLRRAALLFARAGVDFVPCPADFLARQAPSFDWDALHWDSESLTRSTLAVHERLGLLWLEVRPEFGPRRGNSAPASSR